MKAQSKNLTIYLFALVCTLQSCLDATQFSGVDGGGGETGGKFNQPEGGNNETDMTETDLAVLDMKAGTGRGFGEECYQPVDCESLNCLSVNGGAGVCTVPCDTNTRNCPDETWECRRDPSLGDVCVPMTVKNTCNPCETDVECGDQAACVSALDDFTKKYCMPTCVSGPDCENGFRCEDIGATSFYCVPPTAETCIRYQDEDGDGVRDASDNCPNLANPDQNDSDLDGVGNMCDICPDQTDPEQRDQDGDLWGDACDNCPTVSNPNQDAQSCNPVVDPPPTTVQFILGGQAGVSGTFSNAQYLMQAGSFAQRPFFYIADNEMMSAYPISR